MWSTITRHWLSIRRECWSCSSFSAIGLRSLDAFPNLLRRHDLASQASNGSADCINADSNICQICLEFDCDTLAPRTSICGPACPAIVCGACLETHVRISLESTLPGILPRVRCPVCLVQIPKTAWQTDVDASLLERFTRLCATACAFVAPCCHNDDYTQLLDLEEAEPVDPSFESFVDAQLHDQIPRLQHSLTRFLQYEIPARAFVKCMDAVVHPLGYTPLSHHEFLDEIALRIVDDERRAALTVAFHTRHRRVITRCCLLHLCFVCKRKWTNDHDENPTGPCETNGLVGSSDLVECRACRVTLVKVEGCDTVNCPCGFQMCWTDELRVQREHRHGLIPKDIDVYDLVGFQRWHTWRTLVQTMVQREIPVLLAAWRRRDVDRGIAQHRSLLRRMLQTYVWQRRVQRSLLPDLVQQLHRIRIQFLVERLRRGGFFRKTIRDSVVTRIWFRWCMQQIRRRVPMYDEESMESGEVDLALGLFGEWE